MNKGLHLVIALSIALVLAVGGYLTAVWLESRQPVDPLQAESMAEQLELNAEEMRSTLDAQIAGQPASAEQTRLESATGQALSRHCIEWTEFYENHPSDDAKQRRDEACSLYRDYVRTGELPDEQE